MIRSLIYSQIYSFIRENQERKEKDKSIEKVNQIDKPKTETMAYIDLFSQLKTRERERHTIEQRLGKKKTISLTERYTIHRLYCPRNMN
jgi:hypothetical protein